MNGPDGLSLDSLDLDTAVGRYQVHCAGGTIVTFDLHLPGGSTVAVDPLPEPAAGMIRAGEPLALLWASSQPGSDMPPSAPGRRNLILPGYTCSLRAWTRGREHRITLPMVERITHVVVPAQVTAGPDDLLQWVNLHTARSATFRVECVDGTLVDIGVCGAGEVWATVTHPATDDSPAKEEETARLLWVITYVPHLPDGLPQILQAGAPSDLFLAYGPTIGHVHLAPTAQVIRVDSDVPQAGDGP